MYKGDRPKLLLLGPKILTTPPIKAGASSVGQSVNVSPEKDSPTRAVFRACF